MARFKFTHQSTIAHQKAEVLMLPRSESRGNTGLVAPKPELVDICQEQRQLLRQCIADVWLQQVWFTEQLALPSRHL